MSSEIAIQITGLCKCYQIYEQPRDRLKQFLIPRLRQLSGLQQKQYYKEFWALKDVSFQVRQGETLGIIGRNGSGKSTLLQMICGTLNPSAGNIQTYGRIAALLELGSGFNPEFTGQENVYLNAAILGLTNKQIDERFDSIASFADIGDFLNQPVKTYSSGMFVRLAFAVIAHVDAQILVIDEALAVGDAYFTQKCMRFLRNFREKGTLVFVSHDSSAVTGLCDSAIWLEKGRLCKSGSAKNVSEAYLASLYDSATNEAAILPTPSVPTNSMVLGKDLVDIREDDIKASNLRNDLQIFSFTAGTSVAFGLRHAEICNVSMRDTMGKLIHHVVGGEVVVLVIEAQAIEQLNSPIIGFSLKDRLGQVLFGDNTYLSYEKKNLEIKIGSKVMASFTFRVPILPAGDYSIAVAVATGTQNDHIQHHWIHDAIIIKSLASSVSTGLIGIPMRDITLTIL